MQKLPSPFVQGVDRCLRRWQARSPPNCICEPIECEGAEAIDATLLVATASGLVVLNDGVAFRILGGSFFGLTVVEQRWYAFRKLSPHSGQIISFELENLVIQNLRTELVGLSSRIHQIDAYAGKLYVTDTENNRLLVFALTKEKLRQSQRVYPAGRASGRNDPNYVHLNSVLVCDERIYLMYHNLSRETGRNSKIAVLNHAFELQDTITLDARCAQNIAFWRKGLLCCSSLDGSLIVEGEPMALGNWSRGIALFGDTCVVGGSEYAKRRARICGDGFLYHCQLSRRRVLSQTILKSVGSIFELRSIDPVDFSISENIRRRESLTADRLSNR